MLHSSAQILSTPHDSLRGSDAKGGDYLRISDLLDVVEVEHLSSLGDDPLMRVFYHQSCIPQSRMPSSPWGTSRLKEERE